MLAHTQKSSLPPHYFEAFPKYPVFCMTRVDRSVKSVHLKSLAKGLLEAFWHCELVLYSAYHIPKTLYTSDKYLMKTYFTLFFEQLFSASLQVSYWCGGKKHKDLSADHSEYNIDDSHFERDPIGLPVGIKMVHLRKVMI